MQDVILTIVIQTSIIIALGYFAYRFLAKKISETIEVIVETLFAQPMVKGSMSVLGKKGAEAKHDKERVERIATQVLDGPQLQGWKTIAKTALGIDVDEMIAEEGAVNTLTALKSIGDTLGIDIPGLIAQGPGAFNPTSDAGKTTGQHLRG